MDQLRTAMCAPLLDIGPLFLQSSQTSGLIVQVQIHFFVTAFSNYFSPVLRLSDFVMPIGIVSKFRS